MSEIVDSTTEVNMFAVKGFAASTVDGQPPERLTLGQYGFEAYGARDRGIVLAEAEPLEDGSHLFVSQRGWDENRRSTHKGDNVLATFQTDITAKGITVSSPIGEILLAGSSDSFGAKTYEVSFFNRDDKLRGIVGIGPEANEYFGQLLGRPVLAGKSGRLGSRAMKPQYRRPFAAGRFLGADGSPLLLTNEASLAESLVKKGKAVGDIAMSQFRPNWVVDGAAMGAYGEDYVRTVRVNGVAMYLVKACARCLVVNIDQDTGQRGAGALAVLGRDRTGRRETGGERQTYFGQNVVYPYVEGATIGLGDEVIVEERDDAPNFIPDNV